MNTAVSLLVALGLASGAGAQRPVPSHQPPATVARPAARVVARVNGAPLTEDHLALAVNKLMPLQSFHQNVSAEKMAETRHKALDGLVDEELQYQDAVRRGITVAPAEIDRRVAEMRQRFGSQQKLLEAVRRSGASMTLLRADIRRELTVKKAYARTVTAKCQVRPAEAVTFFRDHPERFVQPEQLHIYAITIGVDPSSPAAKWIEAKSQAEDILGRIRKGASFEDMARKYSTDKSKASGGDMGLMHRGTLNDDFEKATHSLPVGEASEVIRTLYGFHIVRVSEIRPAQRKTFTDVGAELQKSLTTQRCAEMADAWKARLRATGVIDITDLSSTEQAEAHGRTP